MEQLIALLPQLIVDGLVLGFVYALVALGFTMVYGVLEFMNFAHSEIFMVGAFVGTELLILFQAKGLFGNLPLMAVIACALLVAFIFAGALGMGIERVAYRPLRSSPKLICLITAIGVSFFLQDVVRLIEGLWKNAFYVTVPNPISGIIQLSEKLFLTKTALLVILSSVLMMTALTLFINKHKFGKAMRAVSQDMDTSALMGISVNSVISLCFFIGAGMGGAGGTLYALQYTLISPYMGAIISIKAMIAAVLGGVGSIPGAMLGGLILGVVEVVGAAFLSPLTGGAMGGEYKDVISFIILITILIFKPSGLLGRATGEKV